MESKLRTKRIQIQQLKVQRFNYIYLISRLCVSHTVTGEADSIYVSKGT